MQYSNSCLDFFTSNVFVLLKYTLLHWPLFGSAYNQNMMTNSAVGQYYYTITTTELRRLTLTDEIYCCDCIRLRIYDLIRQRSVGKLTVTFIHFIGHCSNPHGIWSLLYLYNDRTTEYGTTSADTITGWIMFLWLLRYMAVFTIHDSEFPPQFSVWSLDDRAHSFGLAPFKTLGFTPCKPLGFVLCEFNIYARGRISVVCHFNSHCTNRCMRFYQWTFKTKLQ